MASLEITVAVRDGKTMSQYMMLKNGKLTFTNADAAQDLAVAPKGSVNPFCENGGNKAIPPPLTIHPNASLDVVICKDFQATEFSYTAQIGTAAPEDPIIIFEKTKMQVSATAAFFIGAAIGAVAVAVILKMRTPRRPAQT